MAICSCSSWSESPSNWRSGCGEEEEDAEEKEEEEGERRDTPKKDNLVCWFRRRQAQRDWAIAKISAVYLRKENTLRMGQKANKILKISKSAIDECEATEEDEE